MTEKQQPQHYVEIIDRKTNEVEKRMGPMSESKAGRVAGGAGINLDWERFTIRIVEAP